MEMSDLPAPEALTDDETGCFNCDWFRFERETGDDDIAVGFCWALPIKPPVKAVWKPCSLWRRHHGEVH